MDTPQESEVLLLIADISGYTRFMLTNHTARVHAHGIVADLSGVVARETRPPLSVNKFEGDAIFMVAARPVTAPRRFSLVDAWRKLGNDTRYLLARQRHPPA